METICQRPVNGDFDFAFALRIVLLRFRFVCGGLYSRDERDEALAIRLLLNIPPQVPGVQYEAVRLNHPGHRTLLDPLAQHPVEVELANLEQVTDGLRLAPAGALASF